MKKITLLTIALLPFYISAQIFIEESNTITDVRFGNVDLTDVDNDSDLDLIIQGESTQITPQLYINNGNGEFTEDTTNNFQNFLFGGVIFVDIDNDSDSDLIFNGLDGGTVPTTLVYSNDGSGIFTEVTNSVFANTVSGAIRYSDIDLDGDFDVLVTGQEVVSFNPIAILYENDGTGMFTEVQNTPFEGVEASDVIFFDMDNDNDDDLLITGQNINSMPITNLYENDSNGVFTEITSVPFEQVSFGGIDIADVDNDNLLDVIITGRNASNTGIVKLYVNNGSGTFTELTGQPFENLQFSSVKFGDIDNDNDEDIIIMGRNNSNLASTKLFMNDGNGVFSENQQEQLVQVDSGAIELADFDADGDLDLITVGQNDTSTPTTSIYRNSSVLSIQEVQNQNFELSLYPNPVTDGRFFIDVNHNYSDTIMIQLHSILGELVLFELRSVEALRNSGIYIGNLKSGVYFVSVISEKKKITTKIILE